MSEEGDDNHPRATSVLFGHEDAEQVLLEAYRSGRIPHAWLIGGPPGIGKATLAYRMARFVLAHSDPTAPAVQAATSLAVDPDNPVARRIAGQAHTDLLVLERVLNERGKLGQTIKVDQVRRSVSFFGSTAGEGGWRIALVDTVDELGAEGENALLKVLEEPPARSLLFLLSHAPGRVLPTIRSRCRQLVLRPLSQVDVARAVARVLGRDANDPELQAAATGSDGSVSRALALLEGSALELRNRILAMLDQLPQTDPRALHALGEAIAGTEAEPLAALVDTVNDWMAAQLRSDIQDSARLARVATAWEKVNEAARTADTYNLERKPLVFTMFGLLADAARG